MIAAAVKKAAEGLKPAVISAVSAQCEGVAYNRRFYLRDGSVAWNPGKKNPEVMQPAGTTDPEVQALIFEPPHEPSKHLPALAIFVNFSMHPDTVGGTMFSADYPGALARRLRDYHGPNCPVLFGNGACGNLNHVDTTWSRQQKGPEEAARIGQLLAAAIFHGEKEARLVAAGPLRVKSVVVPLEVPRVTEATAERARETLAHATDSTRAGFMESCPSAPSARTLRTRRPPGRGRGPGNHSRNRPRLDRPPRRTLRRTRPRPEKALTFPTNTRRLARQREPRLHPRPPKLRRRQLRTRKLPRCPRVRRKTHRRRRTTPRTTSPIGTPLSTRGIKQEGNKADGLLNRRNQRKRRTAYPEARPVDHL